MKNTELNAPDPLLQMKEVLKIVPCSVSTLYRALKAETFPQPLRFGSRRYWRRSDIELWIAAAASRDQNLS
jgi:predicted DNA-binding transcriptional regulator AlpA